ncbi:prephenate dehydratase [Mycolicibacterium neworleansense]|uniref:prephenate dehydratase n=1 Tax=Mycolicibacterium neworleansense TaxID=146018 RepID=A0A0H5RUC0_9MYCO|nr:prephenate dehydratase [Mycolicibacterium neworleansense]
MPRIAYLGPEGTFTELALLQMVAHEMVPGLQSAPGDGKDRFTPVLTDSTPGALAAVRDGRADYACVPIENSIEGSVLPTLDSLAVGQPLQIYAELTLDVAFTIVIRPGHSGPVRTVAAFPVALAQVRRWLAANLPDAAIVPATSNAAAAHEVAEGNAEPTPEPASSWSALPAYRPRPPAPTAPRWCCDWTTPRAPWSRR